MVYKGLLGAVKRVSLRMKVMKKDAAFDDVGVARFRKKD